MHYHVRRSLLTDTTAEAYKPLLTPTKSPMGHTKHRLQGMQPMGDGWLREKHLYVPDVMQKKIPDFHCKPGNLGMRQLPLPTVYTVPVLLSVFNAMQMLTHNKTLLEYCRNRWENNGRKFQCMHEWRVVAAHTRILRTFKEGNMPSSSIELRLWYACIWWKIFHSCADFQAFKVGIYLILKQKF